MQGMSRRAFLTDRLRIRRMRGIMEERTLG